MSGDFNISASTPIGRFKIIASSVGLRCVYWPGEKFLPSTPKPQVSSLLKTPAKQLADYFDGVPVRFSAKLDLRELSPFAQKVLRELAKVPYGKTISYGELAKRAGSPKAGRAVGNIVAKNPLPIIVPCHRVIASDGGLGGFSGPGGLKLKRQLLLMEKETEKIWIPHQVRNDKKKNR